MSDGRILTHTEKLERSYNDMRQKLREVTSERDHLQVSHNALRAERDRLKGIILEALDMVESEERFGNPTEDSIKRILNRWSE